MRVLSGWLVAVAALATLGCSETSVAPANVFENNYKNLLIITMDTTRADALGTYGQSFPTSPAIDVMASEGVTFEQAMTSSPETLPSHATLFTGLQPFTHGARENAGYVLSLSNLTLAEFLKRHGYRTGAEIAAPVLRHETHIAQGFDDVHDASTEGAVLEKIHFDQGAKRSIQGTKRVGSDITRRGIEFIQKNRADRFFLWLHYFDPHSPHSAPAMFNTRVPESPYHAEVASTDFQVGLVLKEIIRLGLRDNTLVILTADHGEGLGDHAEPSHSYFVYESTMRVPLIFWGLSELPGGLRIESLVRTLDIASTALDLLGLPPMPGAQGVSLAPLIRGKTRDLDLLGYGEATRFAATFNILPIRTVREGRWKYIHKVNPELYDLGADPGELNNVVAANPRIASQLLDKLGDLLRNAAAVPVDSEISVDSETEAALAALGYVGGGVAEALWDELASLDLKGPDPTHKVGDVLGIATAVGLMNRGEFGRAQPVLKQLYDSNPDSPYVVELYARGLLASESYALVVPVLRRFLALTGSDIGKERDLAYSLEQSGDPEAAIDLHEKLRAKEGCHEQTLDSLNRLLRSAERYGELIAVLKQGASECPRIASNQNNYAWALATVPDPGLRDGPLALRIIRGVIKQSGNQGPAYLDTLAAALAETGEFKKAEKIAGKVVASLEADGVARDVVESFRSHQRRFAEGKPLFDPPGEEG